MEKEKTPTTYDAVIIGAGASGLFCASQLGKKGSKVALLDHNKTPGRKILISGGGRCNFTNLLFSYDHFVSENPHFFKSALKQYQPEDFIDLVKEYKIPFYEKKLGQLFCKKSAKDILHLLVTECNKSGVKTFLGAKDLQIYFENGLYQIKNDNYFFMAKHLIVATGGLSIPSIGASDLGYKVAKNFGHRIIPTRPGLVPFVYEGWSELAGISLEVEVSVGKFKVKEDILITHKGFSGPAILKASLHWKSGEKVVINWLPSKNLESELNAFKTRKGSFPLGKILGEYFPHRFVQFILAELNLNKEQDPKEISSKKIRQLSETVSQFSFTPHKTEGFRKAEVTIGGVDTKDISSKTMESKKNPGLYFIGEVLDVTGQLGGYNFQWAWASAFSASKAIIENSLGDLNYQ